MAFTVGWPVGNSVVGVEYADQYFADRGVTSWTGPDDVKQGALVRATDYIRNMFAARFDPLLFIDADLNAITPEALERACCEYALVELKTPGGLTVAPVYDPSGFSVITTKKKIGPLEKNFAVAGVGRVPTTRRSFPAADALIASLLATGIGLNRVTR